MKNLVENSIKKELSYQAIESIKDIKKYTSECSSVLIRDRNKCIAEIIVIDLFKIKCYDILNTVVTNFQQETFYTVFFQQNSNTYTLELSINEKGELLTPLSDIMLSLVKY